MLFRDSYWLFILADFIVLMCIIVICQRLFKQIYGYGWIWVGLGQEIWTHVYIYISASALSTSQHKDQPVCPSQSVFTSVPVMNDFCWSCYQRVKSPYHSDGQLTKVRRFMYTSLFHHCSCFDAPSRGNPENIRIYPVFLETRIIGLHFAAVFSVWDGSIFVEIFWWVPCRFDQGRKIIKTKIKKHKHRSYKGYNEQTDSEPHTRPDRDKSLTKYS